MINYRTYHLRFTEIYFIDASSEESINTAFEDIGLGTAFLPEPSASDTLAWLCTRKEDWLVLFDNADPKQFAE